MANAYVSNNRFVLDTAGSTLLRASLQTEYNGNANKIRAVPLTVKGIMWLSASATAGHQVVIQDENSVLLWGAVASGSNYKESDLQERHWTGDFKVTTLGSGTLIIYLAL